MPGIPDSCAEAYLELKRLTDELHAMIESGEFYTLSLGSRRRQLRAVKRLYNRLVGPVAPRVLVGAVAAGVLLLAGCFQPTAQVPDDGGDDGTTEPPPEPPAQVFVPAFSTPAQVNPYGIGLPDGYLFAQLQPILADLDGDADLDLVYLTGQRSFGTYYYHYVQYHQDGLTQFDSAVDLGLPRIDPYSSGPTADLKTFVDIDADGDLDAVLSGYFYVAATGMENGILLSINAGDEYSPAFAPVTHGPFAAIGYDYATDIAFSDIDGDGDQDMLFIRDDGLPKFSLNNGSAQSPDFLAAVDSPYIDLSIPNTTFHSVEACDIDNDGDVDLLVGAYYNYATVQKPQLLFYENIGSRTAPDFAARVANPFGIAIPDTFAWGNVAAYGGGVGVAAGDVDSDGDLDLVLGPYSSDVSMYYYSSKVFFFENTGTLQDVQ